jgi:hypothetical protein
MKMKNILLSLVVLLSAELCWAQNGFSTVNVSPDTTSKMKYTFPLNLKSGDPLNTIQAFQDFNKRSATIVWRTNKTLQLDSIVIHKPDFSGTALQRSRIRSFTYTDTDRVSSASYFQVSPQSGDTTGGLKEAFTYNTLFQLTEYEYSFWNSSNATWNVYGRQILDYNDKGLLSGYTTYYNDQNEFVPESKIEITYNDFQLPDLEVDYNWVDTLSSWKETYQYEYTYNGSKKLNSETLSYKADSTSQWVWLSKTEYGYGQGVLLTKTILDWNVDTWNRVSRSFFTYDDQHNLILQADKVWMDPPQMWLDDMEYRYEYDSNRRVSATNRRWFQDGHEWIIGDSTAIAYNSFSDTTSVIQYYSPTSGPESLTFYTYDTDIDFSSIRWPISYWAPIGSTFNKQVKEVFDSNRLSVDPDSSIYYYSLILTAATEIPKESWSVYPNPAKDEIKLLTSYSENAEAIEIYSLEGKLLKTLSAPNEITIPIQDLAPGMYVFRIKRGNTFLSGQFIKQ